MAVLASYLTHTNDGELITHTAVNMAAQPFTVSSNGNVGTIQVELKKVGTPLGTLRFRIYDNAGGASNPPGGTLLGGLDTVTDTSNTSTFSLVSATIASPFALVTATTYWLVVDSTGTNSSSNYWLWGMGDTSIPYTNNYYKPVAGAWTAEVGWNLDFEISSADPAINVSDSVTISESKTITLESLINKSESISISESVSRLLASSISKSESITISESTSIIYVSSISVSDSITVSESQTLSNSQLGNISVSDTVSVTDTITLSIPGYFTLSAIRKMRSKENDWPLSMDDQTIL